MQRAYYDNTLDGFRRDDPTFILGELARHHRHDLVQTQRDAWVTQIAHLKAALERWGAGHVLFEYAIPRMGKRADVVLVAGGVVYVVEYKVGAEGYASQALDQVLDYALDLKHFHEGSHEVPIVPVLVATRAPAVEVEARWSEDGVAVPARANATTLGRVLERYACDSAPPIDVRAWLAARYKPTPTIVEAAKALYEGHSVRDISRADAGAINLSRTTEAIGRAIEQAKRQRRKTICFVTGVPGSGKTLAGLNLATQRMDAHADEHAVFLSGNGPLVTVLREALVRDEVQRSADAGGKLTKRAAKARVDAFIQNIHHFRDESLRTTQAPVEKVVVFDEAQRAWGQEQASRFMREKRQLADFEMSEPEFLLSVMDRHADWCAVVCLVGGGQEINTGEAGLSEWLAALARRYRHWRVLYSERIASAEYAWGPSPIAMLAGADAGVDAALHLATSVRSFRAESVSAFVSAVISGDAAAARATFGSLSRYPIVLTRDLDAARRWLRQRARGTERYGLVASANALRLKAVGLHVKAAIDEAPWFLNGKDDVRSSYALEDVATEFAIQGLELDWVGVCWDANLRYLDGRWHHHAFKGNRWQTINDPHRRIYLANAYRVLLTRARQGMVIYIPHGTHDDPTRPPAFYDGTFAFLRACGVPVIDGADS